MQNFDALNHRLLANNNDSVCESFNIVHDKTKKSMAINHDKRSLQITNTNQLISQIRENLKLRNQAIEQLYNDQHLNRIVKGTLINMGCSEIDSHDYFTEAIVNFIQACYKPSFEIRTSLANYLTGIAKNLWLKEVTRNKKKNTIDKERMVELSDSNSPEVLILKEERKQLLYKILNYLGESCKKVLMLWAINKRMKEIANEMDYKSPGMARKKKHQCLRKLYKIIDEHPSLIEQLR